MHVYGLTGGIASGKSTVANLLETHELCVIDADKVSREIVCPGEPALKEIEAAFGPEVLLEDGNLNRAKLGSLIFTDPEKRQVLNGIMHPRVQKRMAQKIAALAEAGEAFCFMDIPLLFEARDPDSFTGIVVVHVPKEVQLKRLMERNTLAEEEALARIASQMPIDEKARRARWVIDNSGDRTFTAEQVELLVAHLKAIQPEG